MIAFYRSACIAPGKGGSALTFAREIAAYLKATYGTDVQVGIPIGGNPNRVGWSVRYDSLAALETIQTRLLADVKYMDMVARAADNFMAGSVHDEIWRIL
jgi:hypothetical protein